MGQEVPDHTSNAVATAGAMAPEGNTPIWYTAEIPL
jgi:hypothetical protein